MFRAGKRSQLHKIADSLYNGWIFIILSPAFLAAGMYLATEQYGWVGGLFVFFRAKALDYDG